jgi:hypothetical protein
MCLGKEFKRIILFITLVNHVNRLNTMLHLIRTTPFPARLDAFTYCNCMVTSYNCMVTSYTMQIYYYLCNCMVTSYNCMVTSYTMQIYYYLYFSSLLLFSNAISRHYFPNVVN